MVRMKRSQLHVKGVMQMNELSHREHAVKSTDALFAIEENIEVDA